MLSDAPLSLSSYIHFIHPYFLIIIHLFFLLEWCKKGWTSIYTQLNIRDIWCHQVLNWINYAIIPKISGCKHFVPRIRCLRKYLKRGPNEISIIIGLCKRWMVKGSPFFFFENGRNYLLSAEIIIQSWLSFFIKPFFWLAASLG